MIVLGLDPGSANFAATLVHSDKRGRKYTILRTTMIKQTLRHMRGDSRPQLQRYYREIRRLVMPADRVTAERYMARGVSRSTTGESIGMMLGLLFVAHKRVLLITAAQWKNCVGRVCDLSKLYRCCSTPPHILDSALIACYRLQVEHGHKPFAGWKYAQWMDLIKQIETKYVGKKRQVRRITEFRKEFRGSFIKKR